VVDLIHIVLNNEVIKVVTLNSKLLAAHKMNNDLLHIYLDNSTGYTVKPANAVTSIKHSLVLKDTFFFSCHAKYHMN
jgi:hypothetical protein